MYTFFNEKKTILGRIFTHAGKKSSFSISGWRPTAKYNFETQIQIQLSNDKAQAAQLCSCGLIYKE